MKRLTIVLLLIFICISAKCQESLAKIKYDYESTGSYPGLKFHKDEIIVIFKPFESMEKWPVWDSSGEYSYVDTSYLQIIPNRPIFKIKSNPYRIKNEACNTPVKDEFVLINVDYCSLICRIINKDLSALTEFFDLIPRVDASLSEIHSEQTWPIINLFTDSELFSWLKTLDKNRLNQFIKYLKKEFVAYPITRYAEYFNLYYPKSWSILSKYE